MCVIGLSGKSKKSAHCVLYILFLSIITPASTGAVKESMRCNASSSIRPTVDWKVRTYENLLVVHFDKTPMIVVLTLICGATIFC